MNERYKFYNIEVYKKGDLKGYAEGLITFKYNSTEYNHEFLYRFDDSENGINFKLVSIDYSFEISYIEEVWPEIEDYLENYIKNYLMGYKSLEELLKIEDVSKLTEIQFKNNSYVFTIKNENCIRDDRAFTTYNYRCKSENHNLILYIDSNNLILFTESSYSLY